MINGGKLFGLQLFQKRFFCFKLESYILFSKNFYSIYNVVDCREL